MGSVRVEVQFSHYFLWLPAMAICAAAKYWRATGARAPAPQHHQVHHYSRKPQTASTSECELHGGDKEQGMLSAAAGLSLC